MRILAAFVLALAKLVQDKAAPAAVADAAGKLDALTVHFEAAALHDLRDTPSAVLAAYERMPLEKVAELAVSRPRVKLMH